MRALGIAVLLAAGLAATAATAPALPPGPDGLVLFTQPRCPAWAANRCTYPDQPCVVDPVTGKSWAPALPSPDAVLSPDATSIAWTNGTSLLVEPEFGGPPRTVGKIEGGTSLPAWSPDGSQLAANGFTLANPAPLEAFDVATGAARTLTTAGVFDPAWSPDGAEVAAAVPDGIVAVPADGGSLRTIATDQGTGNVGDNTPAWSPDSATLAFTHLNGLQPSTVQLVSRDGSDRRDLTQGSQPSWSPDGSRVAFVRDAGGGQAQIWIAAADGSGERSLSATPFVHDARPRWLPQEQTAAVLRATGSCDLAASGDGERVEGGAGTDTIFVLGSGAEVHGNDGDDLIWTGSAFGGGGPESLDGGAGNDDFELYTGRNTVVGGTGNDRVDALFTSLPQRVLGGPGRDWIRGGAGNDVIDGGDGPDALYGGTGANTIHGGAGNDVVAAAGGSSPQRLYGDAGDDRIVGGHGPDRLDGGPGNDTITARDGQRDLVLCGPGHDTAYVDRHDVVRGCEHVFRTR